MIALKAEDVKSFTTKLFVREDFDAFLVKEVNITTYNSFSIDGHVKQGYYTEEEREENNIEEFSTWKTLRPFCFSLIKGKSFLEVFASCCSCQRRDRINLPQEQAPGSMEPDRRVISEYTLR